MKTKIFLAIIILLSGLTSFAQIKNSKTETVKISGNCDMCKNTIETAGNKKGISKTEWNEQTKFASITYNSEKTTKDAVLKNIALAGYDSELFLAPDAAYNSLPNCCKYDRENKSAETSITPSVNMIDHSGHSKMNKTDAQKENDFQIVFNNYFLLKDALIKSDGVNAAANAKILNASLLAIKMETLKEDEHLAWMKLEKDLKFHAEHIAETMDLGHQRDHFSSLSLNMYTLLKSVKPTESIYYQNCPMFNDGKGANWLSRESAIKNPYYGVQMLSCGKTIETIK